METAQEVAAYERDEGEKVTAAVIKKALKALIDDLKDSPGRSARKELERLQKQDRIIKTIEKRIREAKAALKDKTVELKLKLQLKRVGGEDYKAETQALIEQIDARLADLDPGNKVDKKKIAALNRDRDVLAERIVRTDVLIDVIGGQNSEGEARELILTKLYDIAQAELDLYLSAEKRGLVFGVENLWNKYAIDGTIGEIAYVERCPEKAVLNSGIFILRCRDGSYDHRWMFCILQSDYFRRFLDDNLTGSTIQHLYQHAFNNFEFPIPEKTEQIKIARIFSTVNRTIEQTEALIAKQTRVKIGLIHDLCTRGVDEHGSLRSEEAHNFKDSPLGRIPVEWEVKEVQELLANVDPPMRSGPFGSALLKEELLESGIPLLGIDNVLPEEFVPHFNRFVAPKKAKQLKRFRVRPGDVMITIMGTVGRCCMVPCDIDEALSSKHVWTIRQAVCAQ